MGDIDNPVPVAAVTMDAGEILTSRNRTGTITLSTAYQAGPCTHYYLVDNCSKVGAGIVEAFKVTSYKRRKARKVGYKQPGEKVIAVVKRGSNSFQEKVEIFCPSFILTFI